MCAGHYGLIMGRGSAFHCAADELQMSIFIGGREAVELKQLSDREESDHDHHHHSARSTRRIPSPTGHSASAESCPLSSYLDSVSCSL